ncbi:FAD-linked oxidase C-terminal domain-containing protein [Ostreiculturibacter nitratireducens]|uniref:FAD-linked oxidase C-terminal domain-containing protein n=1 Tax=Ostreiculturibacter nitratireducens TaxID=3075226 RepID=UPI003CCC8AA9
MSGSCTKIRTDNGIGLLNGPRVSYTRNPEGHALTCHVKAAFGPANVLNPGKIIDCTAGGI